MKWKARRQIIEEAKVDQNKDVFFSTDIDRADKEPLGQICNLSAKKSQVVNLQK